MKKDIHPKYNKNVNVSCACGASFVTGSTKDDIKVELCSACHPFYTGEMRFVDTKGRIDKFRAKEQAAASYTKKKKDAVEKREKPKTLKEMLTQS